MSVVIAHVEPTDAREAFQWHRGFSAANQFLFPRSWDDYERLADEGRIICARESGYYVGLCYYIWDEQEEEWELGGLMVDNTQRGRALGSTLMRVTLGHLLFDEEPLSRRERIISHVHSRNEDPRRVIEGQLKFAHRGQIEVPSEKVPGLPADEDGFVRGELFEFEHPKTLLALADWCEGWDGRLRDGSPADIMFKQWNMPMWAEAFKEMASDPLGY